MVSFYILLSWVSFLGRCACVVSPQEQEVGLTIYYQNDLLGPYSNSPAPILIVEPSHDTNGVSCESFEEKSVAVGLDLSLKCSQSAPLSNATYADNSSRWWVEVHSGDQTITGFRDRASFRFLGVRYAPKPPRFGYSTTFNASGSYSALSYGADCVQLPGIGSEDCLFLNIFTTYLPDTSQPINAEKLKPVLLYIHGGGFISGTGSDPEYDGGNMASRGDVVVVTINYRLGAFGFLPLNDTVANGNYGISDQVTALDWVRANIAAFGGDQSRITIAGQSAGAASVHALLGSQEAVGKYSAALPMSNVGGVGVLSLYSSFPSIAEGSILLADPVLAATSCSGAISQLNCLRSADAQVILESGGAILPPVVTDGKYITTSTLDLNGTGLIANVHLLLGNMHDEAGALIPYPNATMDTRAALEAVGLDPDLSSMYPDLFPVPSGPNSTLNIFNMTVRASTDGAARCPDQNLAIAGVRNNLFKSVWYYEYERSYQPLSFQLNVPVCDAPITADHPYGDTSRTYFRCHGGDVYYVFGNLVRQGRPARDDIDVPFSQLVVDLFTSFIRSYDPNPDTGFLRSRNYTSTLNQVTSRGGVWKPVLDSASPMLHRLDWPTYQAAFSEMAQCRVLGI